MRVEGVSYRHSREFSLENINFQVDEGEVVGILGSNGSGKSTLVKGVVGINQVEGRIDFQGEDLMEMSLGMRRKKIAYLPQESHGNNLSVYETIMLGRIPYMKYRAGAEDKRVVDELIDRFGLEELRERRVISLSGGERQRAYIARLMAQNSEVIVMDEPTSSLDLFNAFETLKLVREFVRERKLRCLIVIHDLTLAGKFCDKLLLLKKGKQLMFGDRESIFQEEVLAKLYGMRLKVCRVEGEYFTLPQG